MGLVLSEEAVRFIRWRTVTSESSVPFAHYLAELMDHLGLTAEVQEHAVRGVPHANILGRRGEGTGGLLLATHFDTVLPTDATAWTETGGDPFAAAIKGDRIYGLGSADAKLDLLAKLKAVELTRAHQLRQPLTVIGTFGEESGMQGAQRLRHLRQLAPRFALVGEPSELGLVTQHKGYVVVEIGLPCAPLPLAQRAAVQVAFGGRAAHSSTPHLGENAITKAAAWLRRVVQQDAAWLLEVTGGSSCNTVPASCVMVLATGQDPAALPPTDLAQPRPVINPAARHGVPARWLLEVFDLMEQGLVSLQRERNPAFDPPHLTTNLGLIRTEPHQVVVTYDVRPLPTQDAGRIIEQCRAALGARRHRSRELSCALTVERNNPALPAVPNGALLPVAKAALCRAGVTPRVLAKSSCSEAPFFRAAGAETLVIGAGRSVNNAHAPNEYNLLSQLDQAVAFYGQMIDQVCGAP